MQTDKRNKSVEVNTIISDDCTLVTSAYEVNHFCQSALQQHGILFFAYGQFFDDGRCNLLSNNSVLYQHFFKKNYPLLPSIPDKFLTQKFHYLIPEGGAYQQAVHDVRQFFNLKNGIDLIEKHDSYFEMTCFASDTNNTDAVNFYLNNLKFLENFSLSFKESFFDLVQKSKIILPKDMRASFTGIKKVTQKLLSNRQSQCLYHLVRGLTAKQIAKVLGLSNRTIEFYLENLKEKFNCPNKSDLIAKAIEMGFGNIN